MVDEGDELLEQPKDVGDEPDDAEVDGEDRVDDQPTEEASDLATESLRELVRYLVHSLVDDPDTVEIFVERRGPSVQIQLRLPEGEMGQVIGRGGRIAKAIRTVLLIAGSRHHLRVSLDIES